MATPAEIKAVRDLFLAGEFDQSRPLFRAAFPSLFEDFCQDLLVTTSGAKVPLSTGDGPAGIADYQNNFSELLIVSAIVDLQTPSSGACTADVGIAATAVTSDTLMDGLDFNAGTALLSSFDDAGANGRALRLLPIGEHLTVTTATGSAAGLAGFLYINFRFG